MFVALRGRPRHGVSQNIRNLSNSVCCLGAEEAQPSTSGSEAANYIEMKGIRLSGAPLYLDMQATTPLDPRVLDSMLPYLTEQYGNPHSRTHMYGWETEDAVEAARKQVCNVRSLQCLP